MVKEIVKIVYAWEAMGKVVIAIKGLERSSGF